MTTPSRYFPWRKKASLHQQQARLYGYSMGVFLFNDGLKEVN